MQETTQLPAFKLFNLFTGMRVNSFRKNFACCNNVDDYNADADDVYVEDFDVVRYLLE